MTALFGFGFAAGLALAIPVGPMAILLISTSIERGWRHGALGALAMASVDGLYAVAVYWLGSAIAGILAQWRTQLGMAGALILLALAGQLLLRNLRLLRSGSEPAASQVGSGSGRKTFAKFVLATVVNPPTALYFLAIAPTVSSFVAETGQGAQVLAGAVFAVGVFAGSVIWQQALAAGGGSLRRITGVRARAILGLIGGTAMIGLALAVAAKAFGA